MAAADAAKAFAEAATTSSRGTADPWQVEPQKRVPVDVAYTAAFESLKPLFQAYQVRTTLSPSWMLICCLKPATLAGLDKARADASAADDERFNLLKTRWRSNPSVCRRVSQRIITPDVAPRRPYLRLGR